MGLFGKSRTAQEYTYAPQPFRTLESFNHDGVEIARRRKVRRGLPLRQFVYFAVAVISFKVFLFFEMGAASYGAKVEELIAAGGAERLAGYAMQLDPVTSFIIDRIRYGF